MKINSISIKNLFEIFTYDISFKKDENVLIITGPNGFGKTMILNIIFNLFNRKFQFFQKLSFEEIVLTLDGKIEIVIKKTIQKGKYKVSFEFHEKDKLIERFEYSDEIEMNFEKNIRQFMPIRKISEDKWMDARTGRTLTIDELIEEYADQFPDVVAKNIYKIKTERAKQILASIQVHLIQEQRLLKKAQNVDKNYRADKEQTIMIETIQTYAQELIQLMQDYNKKSLIRSQELDSSYPRRLTIENNILTQPEYEKRYKILKSKQKNLTEFGLYDESKQELLNYNPDDAKALSVYLKDLELKLNVSDNLLEKLELFTTILNERRFTFKSIKINPDKGFYFETSKGKELDLNQLSSGEQHEVVLLYELIFNVKPDILVLIDEPEISLHITWQKEFLNDLLKIIKIQNIQVVIATHAPSIINGRWDLVYNLETEKTA